MVVGVAGAAVSGVCCYRANRAHARCNLESRVTETRCEALGLCTSTPEVNLDHLCMHTTTSETALTCPMHGVGRCAQSDIRTLPYVLKLAGCVQSSVIRGGKLRLCWKCSRNPERYGMLSGLILGHPVALPSTRGAARLHHGGHGSGSLMQAEASSARPRDAELCRLGLVAD